MPFSLNIPKKDYSMYTPSYFYPFIPPFPPNPGDPFKPCWPFSISIFIIPLNLSNPDNFTVPEPAGSPPAPPLPPFPPFFPFYPTAR